IGLTVPDEAAVQVAAGDLDAILEARLMLVEQFAEPLNLAVVLAVNGDVVRRRRLRELDERLLDVDLELLHRADRQLRDESGKVAQERRRLRALLELRQLERVQPRRRLEDGGQRVH